MFDKEMAYSLICLIDENLRTMLKRTVEVKSPNGFTSSEKGMNRGYSHFIGCPG